MIKLSIQGVTYAIDTQGMLTPAEERELANWFEGLTTDEAAARGCRSVETIKRHRKAIRAKCGQHSGIGVLTFCLSRNLLRKSETARASHTSRLKRGRIRMLRTPFGMVAGGLAV